MKNKRGMLVKVCDYVLISLGLVMFFNLPHRINSDGLERYMALAELLTGGKVSNTKFSLIGPIFSTPLYFLGNFYQSARWWCERYNFVLFVLGLVCIHMLLFRKVDNAFLRQFIIILIFGSMFSQHQMDYFGEVFTAILVGVGMLAVTQGYVFSGWASIILGVANTPATLVGLGFVVLALVLKYKKGRYILILGLTLAVILLESWFRSGGIFSYSGNGGYATFMPYSGRAGFSYPLFFGLLSILFSFGKGIFWFAPGLLMRVKKGLPGLSAAFRETYQLWILFLVGLVLVYSKWWSWYGGWYWGPRFFLFASIPASFALAANLHDQERSAKLNLAILAILSWSLWVGLDGAVFGQNNMSVCIANDYKLEALCWYVPEFGALFRPFVDMGDKILSIKTISFCLLYLIVFFRLALPVFAQLWRVGIARLMELKQGFRLQF